MKLRLLFVSLLIVLLIPISAKAETTVLPADPSITNVDFSANNEKRLYKTGDILNISFQVNNMTYSSGKTIIHFIYYGGIEMPDIIYDIQNNTTMISNNNSWISDCVIQFNKDNGNYILNITVKDNQSSNQSFAIDGIVVVGDKEVDFRDCNYVFIVNDNCASGNHTIKEDTKYTIDKFATCTKEGSKSKKCIICDSIVDETIEKIPALGHTPSEDYITIKHATCVEKGSQAKKCTVCGEVLEDTILEIPIDPHYHVGGFEQAVIGEDNNWTYYGYICKLCKKQLKDDDLINGNYLTSSPKNAVEKPTVSSAQQTQFTKPTQNAVETVVSTPKPTQTTTPTITTQSTQKEVTTAPSTPTIKYVKNNKKKTIIVTWDIIDGVKGYEVQYAFNNKFTKSKKSKTVTKNTLTIKKLKKGKTYYVRVRGYNIDSDGKKVYGGWSGVKKVKVKK